MLNIAIVGPGLVGSEFIAQLAKYISSSSDAKLPLRVVGICNSTKMLVSSAWPLATWKESLANQGQSGDLDLFLQQVYEYKPCVVVDCTSSETIASKYPDMLKSGLHVVTPNKKAFSSSVELYKAIKSLSAPVPGVKYPFLYHEATVGAGLPIINTLNDLINTGDQIKRIEGIFSGTLAFIFNTFSSIDNSPAKFSDIVKIAKDKGYTEPDPRDDLNGVDVARKVIILARTCGMTSLTLEKLPTENIVPAALRPLPTAEFMEKLPQFDAYFEEKKQQAFAAGQVLRYVGFVDMSTQTCGVELKSFPFSHPFASMKGSDNVISFHTARFSPQPLLIQGAGAGAAVTAFGIFSDVLKVATATQYAQ